MTADESTGWTPGLEPDPREILQAARADAAAERYAEALEKHLWIHHHSLTYQPSFCGVRLSYALVDWVRLAWAYPPALEALLAIRQDNVAALMEARAAYHAFNDLRSINHRLGQDAYTVELFLWLHSQQPEVATAVYHLAQPELIKAGEYRLCGHYLKPEASFTAWKELLRQRQMVGVAERVVAAARRIFTGRSVNLVALLVLNDRRAEADRIAELAAAEWDDPEFHQHLEAARQGQFPPPRRRDKGSAE